MVDLKALLTKIIEAISDKVSKAGDTMYGDLTIAKLDNTNNWQEARVTCTTASGGSGRMAATETTGRFGLWDIKHRKWIIRSESDGSVIAYINPVTLYNTKLTAPTTQNQYAYASAAELANYNVVLVRCECGNVRQMLVFCRLFGDSPLYIFDNNDTYLRGGFLVDWTNNRIGVRWVNGTSQMASNVFFQQVYGIL